ncbi:MAG: hypothetical protein H5U03_09025 [Clostridia bacterium]|nr:hypothetical protein [Clostridia bacterium]
MIASILGRGMRFFAVALLLYVWGEKVRRLIDRYFNAATVVFLVLLIGGFLFLKYVV